MSQTKTKEGIRSPPPSNQYYNYVPVVLDVEVVEVVDDVDVVEQPVGAQLEVDVVLWLLPPLEAATPTPTPMATSPAIPTRATVDRPPATPPTAPALAAPPEERGAPEEVGAGCPKAGPPIAKTLAVTKTTATAADPHLRSIFSTLLKTLSKRERM
jgi:hypothetical protein